MVKVRRRAGTCALLILLVSGIFACAAYSTYMERWRNNEVVLDAWARGKRAEERGEYQSAKEEYYFVKRFATTFYLREESDQAFERVSRILEETKGRY